MKTQLRNFLLNISNFLSSTYGPGHVNTGHIHLLQRETLFSIDNKCESQILPATVFKLH